MNYRTGAAPDGSEWLSAMTPEGIPSFPISLRAAPCLGFYQTSFSAPLARAAH